MCRSDSGADTRDSENTFPASLADEKNRRELRRRTRRQRRRRKLKKENEEATTVLLLLLTPQVVVTVIKHFGNVGDFVSRFLKPPCQ